MRKPKKTDTVRARIDPRTKQEAEDALEAMGLTVSDAIRIFITRIATDKALPFHLRAGDRKARR